MTVQGVLVSVGDWLRCEADDWEGLVLDVDEGAQLITLRMNNGDLRSVAPEAARYNWWDPKLTG